MRTIKISNIQLGMLSMGFLYGSSAIIQPAMLAKRDAWLALLLGWLIGLLLILSYLKISKLNYGKNLNQILEVSFGPILGKILIVSYILFFIFKAAVNTRAFGEFMATVSYPETPISFIMGVFLLTAVIVVRSGLDGIGRVSEIFVPLIPFPILIVATSFITMKNYSGFQPILLEIVPVVKSILSIISNIIGDFVIFLIIIPYTNKEKGRTKSVLSACIVLLVLMMIVVARNLIVIGPELISNFTYPSHVSAQLIPGLNIDPLVDVNLLMGGGIKVVVCLYAALKATVDLLKINNYKPMINAFALLIIVLAFWIVPNNIILKAWTSSWSCIILSSPFQILIPIILLMISFVKYMKTKKPC